MEGRMSSWYKKDNTLGHFHVFILAKEVLLPFHGWQEYTEGKCVHSRQRLSWIFGSQSCSWSSWFFGRPYNFLLSRAILKQFPQHSLRFSSQETDRHNDDSLELKMFLRFSFPPLELILRILFPSLETVSHSFSLFSSLGMKNSDPFLV